MQTIEAKAIEILAAAKAIADGKAKTARAEVLPGEYTVDAWVRVFGTVKVGEDYEQNIVAKAEPWKLLAVALSKLNGVTVESLVAEALDGSINEEEIKARADEAMKAVKAPTLTACKGKVTTKLNVEFASEVAA